MTRTKHIFRQDAACLEYMALGDTAVRIIAIDHIVRALDFDAIVVPPRRTDLIDLWTMVFGPERVIPDPGMIPDSFRTATVSRPTTLDWWFGSAAWTVFESVMWENGFFQTRLLRITPPVVFVADHSAASVMIYPAEASDGNRVYNSEWWIATCAVIRQRGYRINCLGRTDHPPLKAFFEEAPYDQLFPPTIQGLTNCVARSSWAIGSSTGPTWALLMSDIPQIVLESKRSAGYWHFDRCQRVLTKQLGIHTCLDSLLPLTGGVR